MARRFCFTSSFRRRDKFIHSPKKPHMSPIDAIFNAFINVVGMGFFLWFMGAIVIFEFLYTVLFERFDML